MIPRITTTLFTVSLLAVTLLLAAPLTTFAVDALSSGSVAIVSGTDGSGLRIRSGPGVTSTVVATLRDGDRVEITGDSLGADGTTWFPVKSSRATGWSNAQYLKPVESTSTPTAIEMQYTAPVQSEAGPEQRLFQLLNETRVARGLNPVAWNSELSRASQLHAQDMARRGYMEHTNPEGLDPRARALNAGYVVPAKTPWLVIETISARQTADAAMEWLLSHQPHAGVLLRPVWREAGAAYVQGGPYGQFWVMNFGCRPNVLPVFASVGKAGLSVDLTLTDELCTPAGQGEFMGRAVEMQISPSSDYSGADWEPFSIVKTITNIGPRLYVRLRDAVGRSTQNEVSLPGIVTAASQPFGIVPVPGTASR